MCKGSPTRRVLALLTLAWIPLGAVAQAESDDRNSTTKPPTVRAAHTLDEEHLDSSASSDSLELLSQNSMFGVSEAPSDTAAKSAAVITEQMALLRPGEIFPMFTGDDSLSQVPPISEQPKTYGLLYFVDYDAFRGISDGGWENNGIRTGFNFASRLGRFSDLTGIGGQVGASVGIYDWGGTDYRLQNQNQVETQGFFTYGLYRRPTEDSAIVAGVVQDWSFNDNFGIYGKYPTMSQVRAQLGYAVSASNEFGIWGTAHVVSSTTNIPKLGSTTWQSVNQISGYWHHKWFAGGPETWISAGLPADDRLSGGGSLGDYLVSAMSSCPLSNVVAVVSSVTYMHQSGRLGGDSSNDEAWNFSVGIAIYPGRNALSTTVAGQRWMPLMPVANNGTFLVDTSRSF